MKTNEVRTQSKIFEHTRTQIKNKEIELLEINDFHYLNYL